jgi:endonuclease YncB( thermonuclease family)
MLLPDSAWCDAIIVGVVTHVVDGDTIDVDLDSGPIRIRLDSIDAPEKSQPFGEAARQALERLVDGQEVGLVPMSQDRYERMVALVYRGDLNVNLELVRNGYAWAYRKYLRDAEYCDAERYARDQKLGLWAAEFAPARAPWEWRAHIRGAGDEFTEYRGSAADCSVERRAVNTESSSSAAELLQARHPERIDAQRASRPPVVVDRLRDRVVDLAEHRSDPDVKTPARFRRCDAASRAIQESHAKPRFS